MWTASTRGPLGQVLSLWTRAVWWLRNAQWIVHRERTSQSCNGKEITMYHQVWSKMWLLQVSKMCLCVYNLEAYAENLVEYVCRTIAVSISKLYSIKYEDVFLLQERIQWIFWRNVSHKHYWSNPGFPWNHYCAHCDKHQLCATAPARGGTYTTCRVDKNKKISIPHIKSYALCEMNIYHTERLYVTCIVTLDLWCSQYY